MTAKSLAPEIAEMVNKSTECTFTILREKLGIEKVFSKWVPRLVTIEQKQQRIEDSKLFGIVYSQWIGFLAAVCDNGRTTDPTFFFGLESAVSWVACSQWKSNSVSFLGCTWYNLHRLPGKLKIIFHQDNAVFHKSLKTMAKLTELDFNLPMLSRSSPQRLLITKRSSRDKKLGVIAETETFFEVKGKSFHRNVIEK